MKFYCLHEGLYEGVAIRLVELKKACELLNITFISLDSLAIDYTNLPILGKNDILYNAARGSQTLESILLSKEVTTFYIKNPELNQTYSTTDWSIIHRKHNLPEPKTIFHLTSDRQLLRKYVNYLGGFPIIIKVTGGTRGIGTMKIESWQNLISTVDYLATTGDKFIMREFIDADFGARIMVLGDEVVQSSKFLFQENDFRNAPIFSNTKYESITLDDETKSICIEAVRLVNLEMAGVDILFGKDHKPYLLEINFPTGFSSFKWNPEIISSKMVNYLIKKAER